MAKFQIQLTEPVHHKALVQSGLTPEQILSVPQGEHQVSEEFSADGPGLLFLLGKTIDDPSGSHTLVVGQPLNENRLYIEFALKVYADLSPSFESDGAFKTFLTFVERFGVKFSLMDNTTKLVALKSFDMERKNVSPHPSEPNANIHWSKLRVHDKKQGEFTEYVSGLFGGRDGVTRATYLYIFVIDNASYRKYLEQHK